MDSSPGFGSNPCNCGALLRLAFAPAPAVTALTSLQKLTRWLILQKARHHPTTFRLRYGRYQALTDCKHTVSGTISLPIRGTFHLSLTVLVHYRSSEVFSLGKWSSRIHAGLHVSRVTQVPGRNRVRFRVRDFHPLWSAFPVRFHYLSAPQRQVLQPRRHRSATGLGSSAFVRHY